MTLLTLDAQPVPMHPRTQAVGNLDEHCFPVLIIEGIERIGTLRIGALHQLLQLLTALVPVLRNALGGKDCREAVEVLACIRGAYLINPAADVAEVVAKLPIGYIKKA